MIVAYYSLVVLFAFVFQTTVFHFVSWIAIYPDVVLILAIYSGLAWGRMGGLQFGALIGFIQDLLLFGTMGINLLSKSLIGFVTGMLREKYINDSATSRVIAVALATLFDYLVYGFLVDAIFNFDLADRSFKMIVPQALMNLAFALVFLPLLAGGLGIINRYHEKKEREVI